MTSGRGHTVLVEIRENRVVDKIVLAGVNFETAPRSYLSTCKTQLLSSNNLLMAAEKDRDITLLTIPPEILLYICESRL